MKKSGFIIILIASIAISMMIGVYIGTQSNGGQIEVMYQFHHIGIINLNTATIDELVQIPGIGEITAQQIVDYRSRKGNYNSVDDLLNISSISKDKLKEIRQYLRIE